MDEIENYQKAIKSSYYAMTTLSTVGFGDLFPKNNFERFVVTIFLLFMGYVCFSYMNANLSEMIIDYLSLDQDFDKSD